VPGFRMQIEFDTIDIVGMLVIMIGVGILSPIMVYALHQFHVLRNAKIMKFRNSSLIIAMNCCIIFVFLERGYFCFFRVWEFENPVPERVECTFAGICISSIYLLVALKTWLLYFEQSYHFSVASAAWKKLINERAQSWFIRHRQTYGDWRYVVKAGALPSAAYMALCFVMEIAVEELSGAPVAATIVVVVAHSAIHKLPLLFSCVIYYRFHSKDFKDLYRISREIKYQCAIVVAFMTLQCAEAVFHCVRFSTLGQFITERADVVRVEALCNFVVTSLFLFSLCLLTSWYPVYIHLRKQSGCICNDSRPRRFTSGISDIATIISHKEGYKALMSHLLTEFSTENLLFITELIQIKYAFQLRNHNVVVVPKRPLKLSVDDTFTVEHSVTASDSNNEGYFDNDKYAVIDFHSKRTSTERPSHRCRLSFTRSSVRSMTPPVPPVIPPSVDEVDEADGHQPDPKGTDTSNTERTDDLKSDVPKLVDEPSVPSKILSGINKRLGDAKEVTKAVYLRGRRGSTSQPLSGPLEITKSGKLPGMHTFLFRTDGAIQLKLALPRGLPPSTALQDLPKKNNLALQYEYLYQKFIEPRALHEVNLSHGIRGKLCTFFGKERAHLTHGKVESFIFNIFDEAALQILGLMCDSFARFASTSDFRYIQREIERDDSSVLEREHREESGPSLRNATSLEEVMEQYGINSFGGLCVTGNLSC